MRFHAFILFAIVTILGGCTHKQLVRSTIHTTTTVMDIHHRAVLTNLAMLSCHHEALPNHIRLADGVVQVNDEAGFGTSGGFTGLNGSGFGIEQYAPFGSRQVTEQWGSDAVGDPLDVKRLQDLYRVALGLPTLPDPLAVAYLKRAKPKKGGGGGDSSDSPSTTSTGGGGTELSPGSDSSGDGDDPMVPIEVLLQDVPPPGWFCIGEKRDVPKDACYVGRYGDCYAWVTPEGMPGLSRFTLAVMNVLKFKAVGEQSKSRGLAVTNR